ncbi:MAG: dihydroorotate dehydrogenase [candidate division WOR-3 bacterium]|nr:MAG: dihydroorotate dehydrogenase [candidate division WOR-3 bacterium]
MTYSVRIGGTTFPNPVLAASGTWGFGLSFRRVSDRLGGIVTKGITLEPRDGNPPPRIHEFPGGIINSVGLENPGLEAFRRQVLPAMDKLKCRVIVNVAGFTPGEYATVVGRLRSRRVDAFELNVSCPNVRTGGGAFGQSPRMVETITKAARSRTNKTLIVKLTANFVDPVDTARAAVNGGADAVTLINTLHGLALGQDGRPFLGGRSGGISGPALRPFALFCVDRVAAKVDVPIIGSGGIMSGQDALDFMNAGACLVQVGTASLVDPDAALRVWLELKQTVPGSRASAWEDIVGRTRRFD